MTKLSDKIEVNNNESWDMAFTSWIRITSHIGLSLEEINDLKEFLKENYIIIKKPTL